MIICKICKAEFKSTISWKHLKQHDITVAEYKILHGKENTAPNYWYFKTNEPIRYHRYSLRKPMGSVLSERKLRRQEGWLRIYDCGSSKFVWTKKSSP